MKNIKKFMLFIMCLAVMFITSSCSLAVDSNADELTASSWSTTLENSNEINLSFTDDNATLTILFADGEKCKISGFCEVGDSGFVIHDSLSNTPYAFEYVVYFDRVELIFESNTVSLYKT